MSGPIRKAVFPVAGLGTRFLPATKAMPKEMLTIVDKPIIQYVVDEAREAGIEHFVFVTGRNKTVIEDHFDVAYELEDTLKERGKLETVDVLRQHQLPPGAASFTRQQVPLGLGHAIACARKIINGEPFAVLLPDVLIQGNPGCLAQMVEVYDRHGGNVVAVEEMPADILKNYGVIRTGESSDNVFEINGMVEKPEPGSEPSNLILTGRYVLQPEIFDLLDRQQSGAGGEIQLTDAMIELNRSQKFSGLRFAGTAYDCGSKLGFLAANLAFALARPDMADELQSLLADFVKPT